MVRGRLLGQSLPELLPKPCDEAVILLKQNSHARAALKMLQRMRRSTATGRSESLMPVLRGTLRDTEACWRTGAIPTRAYICCSWQHIVDWEDE